ncbi:MAG: glycerol-3-phosphate acyltransferase, partial [Acidobacteriota bacterium]|nr:glycerol-3-phosphate acyltransferase [Acidobacteriota bacterium]
LAVVAGHVWPLYSGFRGGKGAATGAGVLLAISPGAWVVCVGVFGVVLWRTRYVSVASMTAAAVSPVAVVAIDWVRGRLPSWTQALLCIGAAGVIIWAHRSNIRSLRNGSETPVRFGT